MKKTLKILFILLICLNVFNLYADPLPDNDADTIKKSISTLMQENKIPGVAIAVYVDGKPSAYYFGYADERKKIPINKYTIFEIGSISKIMTSILLAQQVDIGSMQLSDSLKKYVTGLPARYESISLRDLATHTSGLPFDVPQTIKTQAELEKYLTEWSPEQKPGEQWVYSNLGIGMLGYALKSMTHKNFNQLYRHRILSPLGMQPIAFTVTKQFQANYAQGYDDKGSPVKQVTLGLFPSAYGIKASAPDMQRFLGAAIGLPGTPSQVFYPMRLTQTAFVKIADKMQGLAWLIHPINTDNLPNLLNEQDSVDLKPAIVNEVYEKPRFSGDALMDKTGTTNGFRAYIAVIPNKKSGVVILANKSLTNNAIEHTGREILFKLTKIMNEGVKEEVKEEIK